ncbi:membrane protein [Roseibium aquae]|uniref:Membrane protein n=1 Tax=Roseibium aquae TaxID=1323746 RepID=A0A916X0Q0_9HYPH|nr:BrnT family toxin [Roseibium aquae]GGB49258.1 membrane protein [Roseibium aquae]
MQFEWDENKNKANIEKHGISFDDAKHVFDGMHITKTDTRFDYGERREITIGMIRSMIITTVVHTDRNGTCRLISARAANRAERKVYHDAKKI